MSNPLLAAQMTAMSLITTENSEHEVLKAVLAPAAPSSETSCSTYSSTQPSESSSPPLHHYTSEEGHEDPVVDLTYVTTTPLPISSRSIPNEDVSGEVDAPPEVAHAGDNDDSVLSKRTSIGWGSIVIYMHPIVPGEHADCLYGPPLTIAWEAIQEKSTSVDAFESERAPRREAEELRLGVHYRRQVLRRLGFGERDLKAAQTEARRRRLDREWTRSNLHWEWWDVFMQSFRRKMGRILRRIVRGRARPILTTKY